MPEFRQNPVTGQWVVIAPDRAKRPMQFKADRAKRLSAEYVKGCPFCPGNEQRTTPEVYAVRDDHATVDREGWLVRVVPNKYPALTIDAEGVPAPESIALANTGSETEKTKTEMVAAESSLRVATPAVGIHEVVIESPAHDKHFALHDDRQVELIAHTLRHRFRMIMQARDVKHVCIFKNHGVSLGASLRHPHFQIIAPAVIPPAVKVMIERQASYAKERGRALFDTLIEEELAADNRLVAMNGEFVVLAPWASQLPYEMWVIPREHTAMFGDLPDGHVARFATMLRDSLLRLHQVLDDPDYQLVIHSSPKWQRGREVHRWFVQVAPRITTPAGFELGTNMYINQVPPEEAATKLRDVKVGDS